MLGVEVNRAAIPEVTSVGASLVAGGDKSNTGGRRSTLVLAMVLRLLWSMDGSGRGHIWKEQWNHGSRLWFLLSPIDLLTLNNVLYLWGPYKLLYNLCA